MQLHLVIRKANLSSFANYTCWGSPEALLALPLEDSEFLKVVEYLQAAMDYKIYVNEISSYAAGTAYYFFTVPEQPLTAYSVVGIVDVDMLLNYIRNNPAYDNYVLKRDILFSYFGWVLEEEKIVTIESSHIENTENWSNLPETFNEVASMYQSGTSISSFQGNNT